MTISSSNRLSRRAALAGLTGVVGLAAFGGPALATTGAGARRLIDGAVRDINAVINSGKSEAAMIADFERIFARYADVPTVARSALGPPARSASRSDLNAFTEAFQGYMARKYGKRFREFIGGQVEVTGTRPVRSFVEVQSVVRLRGQSPIRVSFMVSDRSGSDRFFDIVIEGISLLQSERTEIGAMLDRRRGDIGALTTDLRRAG